MKLPVVATIIEGYRLFFANLGIFARLVWLPAIVEFSATVWARYYLPATETGGGENFPLLAVSLEVAALPVAVPAITAWYRLVILGNSSEARIRYSIQVEEWRYLLRGTFLILIAVLIILGLAWVVWEVPLLDEAMQYPIVEEFVFVAILGCSVMGVVQWLFVLPAVAVGKTMTFSDSLSATKGNTLRLFLLVMVAILPSWIAFIPLDYAFFGRMVEDSIKYPIEYLILESTINWFFFTINISVVALAYKKLVPAIVTM